MALGESDGEAAQAKKSHTATFAECAKGTGANVGGVVGAPKKACPVNM